MIKIEIFNAICNAFVALGTCGAVIVSLYLARQESKPKLKVSAYITLIMPGKEKVVTISCINEGKQKIQCIDFAFNPHFVFKKPLRIKFMHERNDLPEAKFTPMLEYSENMTKYYDLTNLSDGKIKQCLGTSKWLAKIKLSYIWKVVAVTNIKEFEGRLSSTLVEEILSLNYSNL